MPTLRRRSDGRYEVRAQAGGARWSFYGRTPEEAWQRYLAARPTLGRANPPATVAEAAERWLAAQAPTWKPRTLHNHTQRLERWILPVIGRLAPARLTPAHCERLLRRVPGQREPNGVYQTLHAFTRFCLHQRWLLADPLAAVPRPAYRPKPVDLPDIETVRRLLAFLKQSDDWLANFVAVALLTGLRPGELAALRWSDIDWSRGLVHVRRAGQYIDGQWVETLPKTRSGYRPVPVGQLALEFLERQRRLVEGWHPARPEWADLVFPARKGGPLQSSVVSHALGRLCRQAGVPPLTAHQLRHAHASVLLYAGTPVSDIARRLGHASAAVTLAVYSHALGPGHQVAERAERALVSDEGG